MSRLSTQTRVNLNRRLRPHVCSGAPSTRPCLLRAFCTFRDGTCFSPCIESTSPHLSSAEFKRQLKCLRRCSAACIPIAHGHCCRVFMPQTSAQHSTTAQHTHVCIHVHRLRKHHFSSLCFLHKPAVESELMNCVPSLPISALCSCLES
jgi:hypothetical protein